LGNRYGGKNQEFKKKKDGHERCPRRETGGFPGEVQTKKPPVFAGDGTTSKRPLFLQGEVMKANESSTTRQENTGGFGEGGCMRTPFSKEEKTWG